MTLQEQLARAEASGAADRELARAEYLAIIRRSHRPLEGDLARVLALAELLGISRDQLVGDLRGMARIRLLAAQAAWVPRMLAEHRAAAKAAAAAVDVMHAAQNAVANARVDVVRAHRDLATVMMANHHLVKARRERPDLVGDGVDVEGDGWMPPLIFARQRDAGAPPPAKGFGLAWLSRLLHALVRGADPDHRGERAEELLAQLEHLGRAADPGAAAEVESTAGPAEADGPVLETT